VDDSEANRDSLRRRLERRGYDVSVAVDGAEALKVVAPGKFDLIVLDVMMPGIDGFQVLDTLRKTYSPTQLPIIMATARDLSEDVVSALKRGANDYVTKPLDFEVVSARVHTQLQLKRAVDQILALEAHLQQTNDHLQLANTELTRNAERTARELEAAAKVQKAFLPAVDPQVSGSRFSWIFEPCTELAGDALNVIQLDPQHVAMYVLDVSGHGVAASLLAVMVTRLLSPSATGDSFVLHSAADGSICITEPRDVAIRLSKNFSIDSTEKFITLFYALYNTQTRELKYVSAGHPSAVKLSPTGPPTQLHGTGMPIGIGETYEQQSITLVASDRVFLFSDGVTEAMNEDSVLFGTDRLLNCLSHSKSRPLEQSIAHLHVELQTWRGSAAVKDDVSILGMECV
jgi:sigma-B regulation protein RsbU (phosphoserine phosphatase)